MNDEVTEPTPEQTTGITNEKSSERLQPGDLLNFVSAMLALASAAIFYIAGWVYESHWYAYYNLTTGMIDLPTERVMIQGVPGIFLLAFALLISTMIVMLSKQKLVKDDIQLVTADDIPAIVVWSNGISGVLLLVFTFLMYSPSSPIPIEVFFASGILLLQLIILYFIYNFTDSMARKKYPVPIATRKMLPYTDEEKRRIRLRNKEIQEERSRIFRAFSRMRYSWLGFIILNLFLVSISISAILGQYEARRGTHFLEGNWQSPETYVFSKNIISSLMPYGTDEFPAGFAYGPFSLVAINADTIYIAEPKTDELLEKHPTVFMIPKNEDVSLILSTSTPPPRLLP